MTEEQNRQFLNLALALSAERDREELLSRILDTAMELTRCDAGTLYLLEKDGLHFCRMVTLSMGVRQGGHAAPISLPPVPLKPEYVCSWSVLNNQPINVQEVSTDTRFDFSGSKRYDEMTGYSTRTMLVIPMSNDRQELIGVMQLINAQTEEGEVVPFSEQVELLVSAIASQAAISLTNMKYSEQITSLLDSLVGALSTAIDERTPYNANHTRNMVKYGTRFLDWLEKTGNGWHFDENRRRSFLLSVWLHDVGKLVVPLEVMDKESRLGGSLAAVENRFREMDLLGRIDLLSGRVTAEEAEAAAAGRAEALEFIRSINKAGFLPDEKLARVEELSRKTYTDENGAEHPWLTEDETRLLSIRKGTLSADERKVMESHVSVTGRILSHVTFPEWYEKVPEWAAAHHELLNGKGYPNHCSGEEIPDEVRLLTILDVFDALTARDRPYKPAMPLEKALGILHSMVQEGGMDGRILELFEQSRAWEEETA